MPKPFNFLPPLLPLEARGERGGGEPLPSPLLLPLLSARLSARLLLPSAEFRSDRCVLDATLPRLLVLPMKLASISLCSPSLMDATPPRVPPPPSLLSHLPVAALSGDSPPRIGEISLNVTPPLGVWPMLPLDPVRRPPLSCPPPTTCWVCDGVRFIFHSTSLPRDPAPVLPYDSLLDDRLKLSLSIPIIPTPGPRSQQELPLCEVCTDHDDAPMRPFVCTVVCTGSYLCLGTEEIDWAAEGQRRGKIPPIVPIDATCMRMYASQPDGGKLHVDVTKAKSGNGTGECGEERQTLQREIQPSLPVHARPPWL